MVKLTINALKKYQPAGLFVTLCFLLSCPFYFILASAGWLGFHGGIYIVGLLCVPSLSALILSFKSKDGLFVQSLKKTNKVFLGGAYALPLIYGLLGFGLAFFFDLISPAKEWRLDRIAPLFFFGQIHHILFSAGEELGWRGYFFPLLLKKTGNYLLSVWISGIVWTLWHYPIILFTDYPPKINILMALFNFSMMTMGINALLSRLRLASESVWPCVLFHASHNFFVMLFFAEITKVKPLGYYFVGEFGAGMALTGILFFIYFTYMNKPGPIISVRD